jgi:hypothetical protein
VLTDNSTFLRHYVLQIIETIFNLLTLNTGISFPTLNVSSLIFSKLNGMVILSSELTRSKYVVHISQLDVHYAEITVINFVCGITVI